MKTIGVVFIVIIIVAGMLVSLSAISGYLDLNIEFGLNKDISAIENSEPPDITLLSGFPSEAIYWDPEFAEMTQLEYAEIDRDSLIIYNPPEFYVPDDPIAIPNPNPPEAIENPFQPIPWKFPPIYICDPSDETSSE